MLLFGGLQCRVGPAELPLDFLALGLQLRHRVDQRPHGEPLLVQLDGGAQVVERVAGVARDALHLVGVV